MCTADLARLGPTVFAKIPVWLALRFSWTTCNRKPWHCQRSHYAREDLGLPIPRVAVSAGRVKHFAFYFRLQGEDVSVVIQILNKAEALRHMFVTAVDGFTASQDLLALQGFDPAKMHYSHEFTYSDLNKIAGTLSAMVEVGGRVDRQFQCLKRQRQVL